MEREQRRKEREKNKREKEAKKQEKAIEKKRKNQGLARKDQMIEVLQGYKFLDKESSKLMLCFRSVDWCFQLTVVLRFAVTDVTVGTTIADMKTVCRLCRA